MLFFSDEKAKGPGWPTTASPIWPHGGRLPAGAGPAQGAPACASGPAPSTAALQKWLLGPISFSMDTFVSGNGAFVQVVHILSIPDP